MKKVLIWLTVCLLLTLFGCVAEPTPITENPTTTAATTTTATTAALIDQTTNPTTATAVTVVTTTVSTVSYIPTTSTTETPVPTGYKTDPIYPTTGVAPQGVAQTKNMAEGIPFDVVTHIVVYKINEEHPASEPHKYCAVLPAGSDGFNAVKDMMNSTEGSYMGSMFGKPWHIYYSYRLDFYADLADEEKLVFGEAESLRGEQYVKIGEGTVAPTYGSYFLSSPTYILDDMSIYSLDSGMCDTWHDFLTNLSYPITGFSADNLDTYSSVGDR